MQWKIIVPPDRIPAGEGATVFIPTAAGIEFLTCPVAVAGSPTQCVGTTVANALLGGTVHVFANNSEVAHGQIVKPNRLSSFLSSRMAIFLCLSILILAAAIWGVLRIKRSA
jgi:hypothetical protein